MKKENLQKISLVFLSCLAIAILGCEDGCDPKAKYERTVHLSSPMSANSIFEAKTHDGYIIITGADVVDCNLTATITARAHTEEKAQELAEAVEIKLVPSGNKLIAKIEKPSPLVKKYVDVSLDATVPNHTDLELRTSDGFIKVSNTTGYLNGKTSDGSITIDRTEGQASLKTSDGSITCTKIKSDDLRLKTSDGSIRISDSSAKTCDAHTSDGNIKCINLQSDSIMLKTSDGSITCDQIPAVKLNCRTSDGHINVKYTKTAPKIIDASLTTSDGSINFTGPPDMSAIIDATTSDGSINTELPITITGKFSKSIKGTIGKGEGKLYLKTSDGSITIR